jgi:hypothetical protein
LSLRGAEKRLKSYKSQPSAPFAEEIRARIGKGLKKIANLRSMKKTTKNSRARRGHDVKWEM